MTPRNRCGCVTARHGPRVDASTWRFVPRAGRRGWLGRVSAHGPEGRLWRDSLSSLRTRSRTKHHRRLSRWRLGLAISLTIVAIPLWIQAGEPDASAGKAKVDAPGDPDASGFALLADRATAWSDFARRRRGTQQLQEAVAPRQQLHADEQPPRWRRRRRRSPPTTTRGRRRRSQRPEPPTTTRAPTTTERRRRRRRHTTTAPPSPTHHRADAPRRRTTDGSAGAAGGRARAPCRRAPPPRCGSSCACASRATTTAPSARVALYRGAYQFIARHVEHRRGVGTVADPARRRRPGDRGAGRSRLDGVHALRAPREVALAPIAARNCRDGGRPPRDDAFAPRDPDALLAEIGVDRASHSARTSSPIRIWCGASRVLPRSRPATASIEIGAGLGSLTLALVEAGAFVTAIEIDSLLANKLRDNCRP